MRYIILTIALLLTASMACGDADRPGGDRAGIVQDEVRWIPALTTLEERIANADVVVRARLSSVAAGTTRHDVALSREVGAPIPSGATALYWSTLEHTFTVQEYLKGTGDNTIVAIVFDGGGPGTVTAAEARPLANTLLSNRDTSWDNREALLFLAADRPYLLDFPQANRYILGDVVSHWGNVGDFFSIASPNDKRWLPAENISRGSRGASGSQRFLLDVPSNSGNTRQAGSSGTITLNQMKSKVNVIEQEVSSGGGSDAYRACIAAKYIAHANVARWKAEEGRYPTWRHDEEIDSGAPAGTLVRRVIADADAKLAEHGDTAPAGSDTFELRDNDAGLFAYNWIGDITTTRPLPAGEYRVIENWIPNELALCDGQPNADRNNDHVYVTVTAPAGTVHEAFFDPVSSGDAIGYFGTGDALNSADFTIGDTNHSVTSLKYEDSAVTLGLSPYNALAGQILEFITGDGTTSLSLEASAATGDSTASTLTWAVGSQPWSSGDQLMLRIRDSNTPPTFAQDAYTFSVAESTSAFTVIGTVKAVDQDGDTVLHKITGGNEGGRFSIDGWEGFILVSGRLDYETSTSYELTVTGTDPGGRSATATVIINVTDVAE